MSKWRKSSTSLVDCVEVMMAHEEGPMPTILVRNSRLPITHRPIPFHPREFKRFIEGVKAGEFDDLVEGVED